MNKKFLSYFLAISFTYGGALAASAQIHTHDFGKDDQLSLSSGYREYNLKPHTIQTAAEVTEDMLLQVSSSGNKKDINCTKQEDVFKFDEIKIDIKYNSEKKEYTCEISKQ